MRTQHHALVAACCAALLILCSVARADAPKGLSPQTIKLPSGPASMKGLGESFAPNPFTGTGSFSIGLELPPAQLMPQLAFAYTAGGGKGYLGLSWDVPVLKIIRTTDKGAPKFAETDRFAVMGPGLNDELVRVSADVPRYRLKNDEAYALFERDASQDRWIVRLPNGQVMTFGGSEGSREKAKGQTYAWFIELHTDAFQSQHSVRYTYSRPQPQGKLYLGAVEYQLHGADSFRNRVVFDHEARPDAFTDYSYGAGIRTDRRLKTVTVWHGPRLLRTYRLGYQTSELHTLLESVEMEGEGGLKAPPMVFSYVQQGERGAVYGEMVGAAPVWLLAGGPAVLEDVNADGLPDLLVGESVNYRYHENIDGQRFADTPVTLTGGSPACELNKPGTLLIDVNGDGARDVVCQGAAGIAYYAGGDIDFVQGRFRGFKAEVALSGLEVLRDISSGLAKVGDFNKDGRSDFLFENSGVPLLLTNQGNESYLASEVTLPDEPDFSRESTVLLDWNGDGELDLVRDEAGRDLGVVRVWYGTGGGRFEWGTEVDCPSGRREWFHWQDLNRDGQTDLVEQAGETVRYYLNDGNGHLRESRVSVEDAPPAYDVKSTFFGDLNGNGTVDMAWITRANELIYLDLYGTTSTSLLARIDNGLGLVTEIGYGTSTEFVVAAKQRGERWKFSLAHPVPVITEIYTTDSLDVIGLTPTETRTLFRYDHGYYDGLEREFRGFARVITTQPGDAYSEGRVTETWHHVGRNLSSGADEESLKGKAYLTYVMNDAGALYTTSQVRWERRWLCEEQPAGAIRVLPACGAAATRDRRKDSLVATAVAVETVDGYWEKGILRSQLGSATLPAFAPAFTGSRVDYDELGRAVATHKHGRIALPGYVPGQDFTCNAACAIGGGERDEVVSYVEHLDVVSASKWLFGLKVCQATSGLLPNGTPPSRALVTAACNAASPNDAAFTALSRSYPLQAFSRTYYDKLALRQASLGLATREEAWLAKDANAPAQWLKTSETDYDSHGLPYQFVNAVGDVRTAGYDESVHFFPTRETFHIVPDQQSGVTDLTFGAEYDFGYGVVTRATHPAGQETRYLYDGLGRLKNVLDKGENPEQSGISYAYTFGSPSSPISVLRTIDRDAVTGRESVSYSYSDGSGAVRLTKVPAEQPHGFAASAFVDVTSRGAKAAVYGTFASNRLGMERPPAGTSAKRTYFDALDRPVEMLNPPTQGSISTRSLKQYRPLEMHELSERDTVSQPNWTYAPISKFDGNGRVRTVTKLTEIGAELKTVTWRLNYDALGRLTSFANDAALRGAGPLRTFAYDTLGRLHTVVEAGLGTVQYQYDGAGNRTAREDETGTETSIYGSFGRVLARSYHAKDGAVPDYSNFYFYDAADPNGPLAGTQANAIGKPAWVQFRVGRRDFAYDERGNLSKTVESLWDGVSSLMSQTRTRHTKTVDYNALGERTAIHLPGGMDVRFTRNGRGSVDGIYAKLGTANEKAVWNDIKYNIGGYALEANSGNGTRSCWRYDTEGLLTGMLVGKTSEAGWSCSDLDTNNYDEVRGNGLVHLRYFRKYDDLVTQVMDLGRAATNETDEDWEVGAPDRSATYHYDRLEQLTKAETSIGTYNYSYDEIQNLIATTESTLTSNGTRTRKFIHGETHVMGAPRAASGNAVTSVCQVNEEGQCITTSELYYDVSGRLLHYQGYDLKYDPQGRVASAAKIGGGSVAFYYDHEGAIKVTVTKSTDGVVRVDRNIFEEYEERDGDKLWSFEGPAGRAEVTQMAGLPVDNYLLENLNAYVAKLESGAAMPPRPVPVEYSDLDSDGNAQFDRQDVERAVIANRNHTRAGEPRTVWRYYVQDAVRSATHAFDSAGDLIGVTHYAPYGATQTQWGLEPSWGFAGTRWPDLREVGLLQFGARMYAPDLGHWVSPDRHIGESPKLTATQQLDTNLYGYSRNNPVVYRDPDGNEPVTLAVAAGIWIAKAAAEGAVDTVIDYAMAKLGGEEFGVMDGLKSFGSSMGMALIGLGIASHGKKLMKLIQLIQKNADKAMALMGPLRKLVDVAGSKLGAAGKKLRETLDAVAKKAKEKVGCKNGSCGCGCFVSGTLVMTLQGPVPIEEVELGSRVYTSATGHQAAEARDDLVKVRAVMRLPGQPNDVWELELLRSQQWLREAVRDGHWFEMTLSDDVVGYAEILSIEPWDGEIGGAGRTVTGTLAHVGEAYDLRLKGASGAIRSTWDHPFFSADRDTWVALAELRLGERLQTANGSAEVESKVQLQGTYRVYNLEVDGEHEYFVTSDAIRVHNCESAESAANAALERGQTKGAAAELRGPDWVETGVSGEVVPANPKVTAALMSTPKAKRAPWHGGCGEIVCFDKALNAGRDVSDAQMRAVNIGDSSVGGHLSPKKACSTCEYVYEVLTGKKP
jgi:RHS repeat-associated protein